MCGFILATGNVTKQEVLEATKKIKHRGPDSTNYYFNEDNRIFMGQNRLSILDDIHGDQPFFSEDRKKILLFNGEIYNHLELRNKLISKGIKFVSKNSDTETLLKGYEYYGEKIFNFLDGQFSIAITDLDKKKIILARDKFGEKPLFYYYDKNLLVVSSELSALREIKKINFSLDKLSLQKYFIFSFVPAPNTIYKKIYKLENAHFCEVDLEKNSLKKSKFFNLKNLNFSSSKNKYKDSLDELDDLIDKSVKSRLLSDNKIGLFLSGGIDSTLISYYAKKYNPDLESFSISIKKESFDEGEKSKRIAEYLDLNSNIVDFDKNYFEKNYN